MSRGLDAHRARQQAVAGLGRFLARRAHNACELCQDRTSLSVIEVAPVPEEPEVDRAVLVCERCARAVAGGRGAPAAAELRFLPATMWSEVMPVQLSAVRLLRRLASEGVAWAAEALDGLYLDPDVEALL